LQRGGRSLDAVCAAVARLEDDPLFNAGRGACLNAEGGIELDASVMDGRTLAAGAVGCVARLRNPVLAARAVMEKSRHVLLVGAGAERFARRQRLKMEPSRYFRTAERIAALRKGIKGHHGTVGAVALDRKGNLAAATSTGGFTGKLPGRLGDSPIIGAGTWAENGVVAVSCTGWGECFIRTAAAHDLASRIRYRRSSLEKASQAVLDQVARLGGDGGLIAVDRLGCVAMPYNSAGMFRAAIDAAGRRILAVFR
jgi:beta-aspartyl-peptidase (threonine type)